MTGESHRDPLKCAHLPFPASGAATLDAALGRIPRLDAPKPHDHALRCRSCGAPLIETGLGILLERPPAVPVESDAGERFQAAVAYAADHVWLKEQSSGNPRGHRPRERWTGAHLADAAFGRVPWFFREPSGAATTTPNREPVFDPVRAHWHPRISLRRHIALATGPDVPMTRRRIHWHAATAISERLVWSSPASPFSAFHLDRDGKLVSMARAGWSLLDGTYRIRPGDPEFLLQVLAGKAGPLARSDLQRVKDTAEMWLVFDARHDVETYDGRRGSPFDFGSTTPPSPNPMRPSVPVDTPSMRDSLLRRELVVVVADAFRLSATSNAAARERQSASAVMAEVLGVSIETVQASYWGIQRRSP